MSRFAIARSLIVVTAVSTLSSLPPALGASAGSDLTAGVASLPGAPAPRGFGGMADDPATGGVVLFGGTNDVHDFGDTWTWDGSVWTKHTPAHSPPARDVFGMAGDAATGTAVLFGGLRRGGGRLHDTWTWDGTDWTEQNPAHSPPGRVRASMAYDAVRGEVVLFGGCCRSGGEDRRDTWTWDGTDWTRHAPAHKPTPRDGAAMSDDAAHGQVVLFGGEIQGPDTRSTWTWDGTDWTRHRSVHSPSQRFHAKMADDLESSQVVLFGGYDDFSFDRMHDTWTWDGTDWTRQAPADRPTPRGGHSLAYDARLGRVLLFGGDATHFAGDTWSWDGIDWTQIPAGSIQLSPRSGPPGTSILVIGNGFAVGEDVALKFVDSVLGTVLIERVRADGTGDFAVHEVIPGNATPGSQRVKATGVDSGSIAKHVFIVT